MNNSGEETDFDPSPAEHIAAALGARRARWRSGQGWNAYELAAAAILGGIGIWAVGTIASALGNLLGTSYVLASASEWAGTPFAACGGLAGALLAWFSAQQHGTTLADLAPRDEADEAAQADVAGLVRCRVLATLAVVVGVLALAAAVTLTVVEIDSLGFAPGGSRWTILGTLGGNALAALALAAVSATLWARTRLLVRGLIEQS